MRGGVFCWKLVIAFHELFGHFRAGAADCATPVMADQVEFAVIAECIGEPDDVVAQGAGLCGQYARRE